MPKNNEGQIKRSKKKGFTVLQNEMLQNLEMTWEARGVLGYLLSLPDDWEVYPSHLEKQSPAGIKVVRRVLKELQQFNYLQRYPVYENGKVIRWDSIVYDEPFCDNERIKSVKLVDGKEVVTYVSVENQEVDLLSQNVQVAFVQVGSVQVQKGHTTKETNNKKKNIQNKNDNKDTVVVDPSLISKVKEMIPGATNEDADVLLIVSDNNLNRIKAAYEVSKAYRKPIDNITAFLIHAIKNDWKTNKKNPVSTLKNFEEESIDYDEVMKVHSKLTVKDLFE